MKIEFHLDDANDPELQASFNWLQNKEGGIFSIYFRGERYRYDANMRLFGNGNLTIDIVDCNSDQEKGCIIFIYENESESKLLNYPFEIWEMRDKETVRFLCIDRNLTNTAGGSSFQCARNF